MASTREELVCLNHELGFFSGACSLTGVVGPCPFGNACLEGTGDGTELGDGGCGAGWCRGWYLSQCQLCGSVWLSCSNALTVRCDASVTRAGRVENVSAPLRVFLFSCFRVGYLREEEVCATSSVSYVVGTREEHRGLGSNRESHEGTKLEGDESFGRLF